jgi:hypothetical protein
MSSTAIRIAALTVVVSGCSARPAVSTPVPTMVESSPTATSAGPAPTWTAPSIEVLTATASGVTLKASTPSAQSGIFTITICYLLPTSSDWLVTDAVLSIGEQTALLSASAPAQELDQPRTAGTEICRTHSFEATLPPPPFGFTVEVQRLETSNPVVEPSCPGAQQALDYLNTGVILFCEETLGYPSFDVSYNPKDIPLSDIQGIVHDAFFGVVAGPWLFHGTYSR